MPTRPSARHHAAPSRARHAAPAREPWDPHYAPPASQAQPPWAVGPAGNHDSVSARLAGLPDQATPLTADADAGSAARGGDPDHGWTLPGGDLDTGSALPGRRTGIRSTLLADDPLPSSPGRYSDPLPSSPGHYNDPLPGSPRRLGDSRPTDSRPPAPRRAGDPPPRSPRRGGGQPPRPPRRARYLAAVLMAVALLGGGGYYLVSNSTPATPTASGPAPARQAPASCAPADAAQGSAASGALAGVMGSDTLTGAAAAPCAGQPFGFVTPSASARQPAHPRSSPGHRRHPVGGGPSSAPSSSAPSASSPGSSPSGPASSAPSSPPRSTSSPSASASSSSPAGSTSGSAASQVLALINQARASAGLAPLAITAGLDNSASAHNATMAGGCGLSHQCPGEPDLGARETAAGVHWTSAGENIGEGGPVTNSTSAITRMALTLTQDMLNEKPPNDGHRRNILSSSFTHIGIAVFRDSSGTVWLTQDFSN